MSKNSMRPLTALYMAGYVPEGYIKAGYITAGETMAEYITAEHITTGAYHNTLETETTISRHL